MLKVACMSVGYPNFRYDIAQENLQKTLRHLEKEKEIQLLVKENVLIEEEDIKQALEELSCEKPDIFLLELGTYSYGTAILHYAELFSDTHLILWAFREPVVPGFEGMPLNSLCALNMYTSFLKRLNYTDFSYVYGEAEEPQAWNKVKAILEAAKIKKELKQANFCIVGGRVPGFFLSNVDELRFKKEIGPQISYYSIAQLLSDADNISSERVKQEMEYFKTMVQTCTADKVSLEKNARIYLALRAYAEKNKVSGYAIKCWPDFQELYQVAVCGVVSRLNQEGLFTSCEGDVTGLATMLIQNRISKQTVFLSDLVNVSQSQTVKLWHCGCASPCLAKSWEDTKFTCHPTLKNVSGVATRFDLNPGNVTICKLSEDIPYKLLAVNGECVLPDRSLVGNQGDIQFAFDPQKLLDLIVTEGIEHHYCLSYDCNMDVLKELSHLMGIRFLTVS
jgi:L-fucose isomerase-like protein